MASEQFGERKRRSQHDGSQAVRSMFPGRPAQSRARLVQAHRPARSRTWRARRLCSPSGSYRISSMDRSAAWRSGILRLVRQRGELAAGCPEQRARPFCAAWPDRPCETHLPSSSTCCLCPLPSSVQRRAHICHLAVDRCVRVDAQLDEQGATGRSNDIGGFFGGAAGRASAAAYSPFARRSPHPAPSTSRPAFAQLGLRALGDRRQR